jgi:hypothetical protein
MLTKSLPLTVMPAKVGTHVFADSGYKIRGCRAFAMTAVINWQVIHKDRWYFR